MTLKLGNADVDAVMYGDAEVNKVMQGTDEVWAKAFTPDKLPGLKVWFDATDYTPGSWPNKARNGAAPVFKGSPAPAISATQRNDRPVVRFKTNEGRLRMGPAVAAPSTGVDRDWTLAYVGRNIGPTNGRIINSIYPPNNLLVGFWTDFKDVMYDNGFAVPNTQTTVVHDEWKMYSADGVTGGNSRLFGNGVELGQVSTPAGWGGNFAMSGYSGDGPDETNDCEVSEAVMYNRKLSDVERQQVEEYLLFKWIYATPKLLGSFTALAPSTTSPNKLFTVPTGKTIPAGSLLVGAASVNGTWLDSTMTDDAAGAGAANVYTRRSGNDWVQGTSCFGSLMVCKVTREIDAGDVINLAHSGVGRNRGAAVFAWFTDIFPDTSTDGSVLWNAASTPTWSTGTQAVAATHPTLDLVMMIGTAATPPYTFSSKVKKIAEAVTAAGSADRGVALGYRMSRKPGARAALGTCSNAVWGAGLVALDYTP